MADNNYGNRDASAQVADDDPFAELTRIMGQTRPVETQAQPDDAAADPFAVDLEKELMGDLEPGEEGPQEAETYAAPASFGADSFAAEPEDTSGYQPEYTVEAPAYEAASAHDNYGEPEAAHETDDGGFAEPFNFSATEANADEQAYEAPAHEASADNLEPQDDQQPELAAAGQGYWSEPRPDAGNNDHWASEANEPQHDDALADVDMDFGDLDDVAEPEDAQVPSSTMPLQNQSGDVSLEDELEMLLGGDSAETSERDTFDAQDRHEDQAQSVGFPEPAQPPRSTIFGRANLGGGSRVDATEHDGSSAGGDHWNDHAADAAADETHDNFPDQPQKADPFAALASIASEELASPVTASPAAAPDLETVEVPEPAFVQHDDLDLPELPVEELHQPSGPLDDYEAEFAYDFPAPQTPPIGDHMAAGEFDTGHTAPVDDDDHFYAEALGFGTAARAGMAHGQASGDHDARTFDGQGADLDDAYIDRDLEEALELPDDFATPPRDEPRRRTGFLVAGAVLGVAILGGIGAFALSLGGGENSDTPVLVKADDEPLKVKPEDPGGDTTAPNQDSVAYEAAAGGGGDVAPQQETLVSAAEEPINIATRTIDSDRLPGVDDEVLTEEPVVTGKSEDRLDATDDNAAGEVSEDVIAVQPRKVRTMIVKPDGTLVAREEAAPVEQQAPTQTMAMTPVADDPAPANMETMAAAEPQPLPGTMAGAGTEPSVAADPEPVTAAKPAKAAAVPSDPATPNAGPVIPSRPAVTSAQPRQQVAQAAPAARTQPVAPAPTATASSEWSMQIASQPSAEGAQETYQNLARRYGSILGGRGVNIVRAEIAGKGTYYRVRIPTSSRSDGVSLCERYKAAGGSCFVSK